MRYEPYCDAVLGDWKFSDKESKSHKGKFVFVRRGEVTLHRDHALDHIDPTTFAKQKVHGVVVLTETKLIDKQNSAESRFRGLELTDRSVVDDVIA